MAGVSFSPRDSLGRALFKGSIQPTGNCDAESKCSEPLGTQDAVEKEANFWANLWGVGKHYDLEDFTPQEDTHPGPITADMVRKACLAFPPSTGLGPDALQPRALLRLSEEGLTAFAASLTAI